WGAVLPDQPEVSVGCDNRRGGFDATQHLLERGAQRIAFLGDASNHYPEFLERYRGHGEALAAASIAVDAKLQVAAISSGQSGADAANALLGRKVEFDAVCAASDLIAIGAMKTLQEHGIRVPDDIIVSGFDDIPLAAFVNPGLTTVQQDTKAAGAILVETLL